MKFKERLKSNEKQITQKRKEKKIAFRGIQIWQRGRMSQLIPKIVASFLQMRSLILPVCQTV